MNIVVLASICIQCVLSLWSTPVILSLSFYLVIGGSDDVNNLHKQNKLVGLLEEQHDYEYDLIVLGGGSGGLSAAKVRDNIF